MARILKIRGKDGTWLEVPALKGSPGVSWVPSVSESGVLSWTNDGGLENPSPVELKGVSGVWSSATTPPEGYTVWIDPSGDPTSVLKGATFTPSVDDLGNLSWTNDQGLVNPETKNIRGPKGDSAPQEAVLYILQTLSEAQKTQARSNIDAASAGELSQLNSEVWNKQELVFDKYVGKIINPQTLKFVDNQKFAVTNKISIPPFQKHVRVVSNLANQWAVKAAFFDETDSIIYGFVNTVGKIDTLIDIPDAAVSCAFGNEANPGGASTFVAPDVYFGLPVIKNGSFVSTTTDLKDVKKHMAFEYEIDLERMEYNDLGTLGWRYITEKINLEQGTHYLLIDDYNLPKSGWICIETKLVAHDIVADKVIQSAGIYRFSVPADKAGEVLIRYQISEGTPASPGTYSVSGAKIIKAKTLQILPNEMLGKVSNKDRTMSVFADTVVDGGSLQVDAPSIKQDCVISFCCEINNMPTITVAHGMTRPYASGYIEVDSDSVRVYKYTNKPELIATYKHNLSLVGSVSITVRSTHNPNAIVIVTTDTGTFTQEIVWNGCAETVKAIVSGENVSNARLSFFCKKYSADVWAYGDSYFDFWPKIATESGCENWMVDGVSGRGSLEALESLKKVLGYGIPKYILWCMGMNDWDGESVNARWYAAYEQVVSICDSYGIVPIFVKVPNTPTRVHTYKNAVISESGYRYVDINNAVGADKNTSWRSGLLSGDNVHPTNTGASVIAARFMLDVPEIF